MKKHQLDHVLRAAGKITGQKQLAIAKYVARREKDLAFNRALAQRGILSPERLLELLAKTAVTAAVRERIRGDIANDFR